MASSDYTPLGDSDAIGLDVSGSVDGMSVSSASPSHLSIGRNSPLNPARASPSSGFDERLLQDDVEAGQSINSSKSGGAKGGSTTPSKDRRAWNPARNTLLGSKMRYYSALRNQAAESPSQHTGNTPRVVRGRVDSFLAPPESVIPPTCTFKVSAHGCRCTALCQCCLKCQVCNPSSTCSVRTAWYRRKQVPKQLVSHTFYSPTSILRRERFAGKLSRRW